jgi:hypothetical protein
MTSGTQAPILARALAAAMRRKWIVAAALIAAAVVAVFLLGLPGLHSTGPSQATAYEQVRPSLIRARDVHSLLLTSEQLNDRGQVKATSSWTLAANGDCSEEDRSYTAGGRLREGPRFTTYDASSNTMRIWSWGTGAAGLRRWQRGAPPSRLLETPGGPFMPRPVGGSEMLATLERSDARARSVTFLGRPAYEVDDIALPKPLLPTTLPSRAARAIHRAFSSMDLVIDKSSGITLERVVYDAKGAIVSHERVTRLEVNPRLAQGTPRVAFPAGVRPAMIRRVQGPYRMSLSQIARQSGVTPIVATWTPPGFALTWATYSSTHGETYRSNNIQVVYRAGLDVVGIQMLWGKDWWGPVPNPNTITTGPKVKLTGGFFAGSTAYFGTYGDSLRVTRYGLTVIVGGSISRTELVRVMNTLGAYER